MKVHLCALKYNWLLLKNNNNFDTQNIYIITIQYSSPFCLKFGYQEATKVKTVFCCLLFLRKLHCEDTVVTNSVHHFFVSYFAVNGAYVWAAQNGLMVNGDGIKEVIPAKHKI